MKMDIKFITNVIWKINKNLAFVILGVSIALDDVLRFFLAICVILISLSRLNYYDKQKNYTLQEAKIEEKNENKD
jgi:hypothetical protein